MLLLFLVQFYWPSEFLSWIKDLSCLLKWYNPQENRCRCRTDLA